MAGKWVVYGDLGFSSRQRRDSALTYVRNQATTRGFTEEGVPPYAAGAVAVGTTEMAVCYTTTDMIASQEAERDISAYASGQGAVRIEFGSGEI